MPRCVVASSKYQRNRVLDYCVCVHFGYLRLQPREPTSLLVEPRPRIRPRAGARLSLRLALRGLAVAPAGLGGLARALLPRLRAPRRQGLADALAALVAGMLGGALQGGLAHRLPAPGRRRLEAAHP